MAAKFGVFADEDHSKLPAIYCLPKLHKPPFKTWLIACSSSCTTTELAILLTSCLKTMSLDIAQQLMKGMVKNYFGLSEIQVKFLID